jgi:hypothetical protein
MPRVEYKECSVCKQLRPLGRFAFKRGGKGTRRPECKTCMHARQDKWRALNRDRNKENQDQWHLENYPRIAWQTAKTRAKQQGVPFTLTVDDVKALFAEADGCPVFGTPFARRVGRSGPCPHSPSIDRFDPPKGYILGNVCIISWRANMIKRDATTEEMFLIAEWMARQQEAITIDAEGAAADEAYNHQGVNQSEP